MLGWIPSTTAAAAITTSQRPAPPRRSSGSYAVCHSCGPGCPDVYAGVAGDAGIGKCKSDGFKHTFPDVFGIVFDPASVLVEEIRKEAGYGGVRVIIAAELARARCKTQIDVGFGDAVNISLGLPKIRTSVDHGTGYDRAGKGIADARGMEAALALAARLADARPPGTAEGGEETARRTAEGGTSGQ